MRRKMPPTKWRPTHSPREGAAWPRRDAPGLQPKPGAVGLPRPVSTSTAKSRRRRLRPGGDGARASVLRAVRRSVPAGAGKVSMAPRRNGRSLWGRRPPGLLRQVVPKRAVLDAGGSRLYVTKGGSPTRRPALPMELPRHASSTSPQAAAREVLACRWRVGLARVRTQAGEAVMRGCRVGHTSIRDRRPVRPWLVVNPGEGTAAPWASWPQPSSENNFPTAARLPRATNSFRFQVLHGVATAARCGQRARVEWLCDIKGRVVSISICHDSSQSPLEKVDEDVVVATPLVQSEKATGTWILFLIQLSQSCITLHQR